MTDMPNLDILLDGVFRDMKAAVRGAFEVGRRYGRHEASEEMKAKIAVALNIEGPLASVVKQEVKEVLSAGFIDIHQQPSSEASSPQSGRAPRGSVRPAVLKAIYSPVGATQSEIVNSTGINENSVRSTLNSLRNEGLARKDGDHWSLTDEGDKLIEPTLEMDEDQENTEADEMDTGKVPSAASATVDLD